MGQIKNIKLHIVTDIKKYGDATSRAESGESALNFDQVAMWVHTKKLPPFLASIARKRLSAKSVPLLSTSSSLSSLSSNNNINTEESCVSGDGMDKNNGTVTTTTDISTSVTSIGSVASLTTKGDVNCCRKRKKEEIDPLQLTKRYNNRIRSKLEKTSTKLKNASSEMVLSASQTSSVMSSTMSINKKENLPPSGCEDRIKSKRISKKCVSSISLCVDTCATPYTGSTSRRGSLYTAGGAAEMRRPRKPTDFGKHLRQPSASSRNLTYDDVQIRELKRKMRDVINRPERNVFMGLL